MTDLLARREPKPGQMWYVYTAADMEEIVTAVWLPADDKLAAVATIREACGRGATADDVSRAIAAVTKARKAQATTETKTEQPTERSLATGYGPEYLNMESEACTECGKTILGDLPRVARRSADGVDVAHPYCAETYVPSAAARARWADEYDHEEM